MAGANQEIAINLGAAIRRSYLRARVGRPLHTIDMMLDELELLNLAGRRRVPVEWDQTLARLIASLPAEVHVVPDLRNNIATTRLMDRLYTLQDILLDIKMGPIRRELVNFDHAVFDGEEEDLDVA